MRGADSSKVKHGVMSGLKLASHVSMASATTSFYRKSGLSSDDSSDVPQSTRNLLEQIVSIDDLQESAYQAVGRRTGHSDILSKALGRFPGLRGLTFYAADLRSIWSNRIIRQTAVTKMVWYDSANGSDNFLLMRLSSPTWERDRWLRLERRPWDSGLKGAVSWISPLIGQSLADALVTLASNPDDLMAHDDAEFSSPREISDKVTPLPFVLDIIDAVHKNCPTHSIASMSNDRLYLWIVMDAINRYHEPTTKDVGNLTAQSNNPYRILRPLERKKGCKEVAEKVGLREENSLDDWELVPEPVYA